MTKREELSIMFYKKKDTDNKSYFVFDIGMASQQIRQLQFINFLPEGAVEDLIKHIESIQSGLPYDSEFLSFSEEFSIFNVVFTYPHFYVGEYQTIHMNDFKILLQEWVSFKNS